MSSFFNRQWQFEQGADPTDNDREIGITNDNKCSECGYAFGESELNDALVIDKSGTSPGTPDGPDIYWFEGHVVCPGCGEELFMADASA